MLGRKKHTHYRLNAERKKPSLRRRIIRYGLVTPVVAYLVAVLAVASFEGLASTQKANVAAPAASTSASAPPSTPAQRNTAYESQLTKTLSTFNGSGINANNIDFYSSANRSLYNNYLGSSNKSSLCASSCTLYDRSGNSVRFSCYTATSSCTTYDSLGNTAHTYCYSYISSCNTTTSSGDSYNTHCYSYINSCSTTGSDGYSSNTHCYSYINSCSTTDSSGTSYDTHCYSYINSCSTTGTDGSYSTTHCYSYVNSCSTTGY